MPVLLERTEDIICNKMKLALETEYQSDGYTSGTKYVCVSLIFEYMHDRMPYHRRDRLQGIDFSKHISIIYIGSLTISLRRTDLANT